MRKLSKCPAAPLLRACRLSDQKRPCMVRAINKYASPRRLDFGWCNGGVLPIIPPSWNFADQQGTPLPRGKKGILPACKTKALPVATTPVGRRLPLESLGLHWDWHL